MYWQESGWRCFQFNCLEKPWINSISGTACVWGMSETYPTHQVFFNAKRRTISTIREAVNLGAMWASDRVRDLEAALETNMSQSIDRARPKHRKWNFKVWKCSEKARIDVGGVGVCEVLMKELFQIAFQTIQIIQTSVLEVGHFKRGNSTPRLTPRARSRVESLTKQTKKNALKSMNFWLSYIAP